ncbi:MAG: eukaryotic-like serine/threonine-protein kinase [Acidobacteriaceae bacterium]|jgi:beta-lactam-binding protein with PASTA domain|nr:eukaryotic-like serine/threonine-protein kinase [Acidobacteriaceae bacterium]
MINFFRLVLAFLAIAMAGLVSAVVTMRFAIHGAEVKVPDLQGLTVSEAVHKTANLGLNLGIDNKYYSVDVPAGRVLAQSPLPGAIVRREWRMRVTESLGPQRVAIPKVVGQQERVAAIEVRRVGLELEESAQMPYSGAPPGTVIAQNPQQGAAGVERPSVSLLVSTPAPNPAPALVMPQLTGMPLAAATALVVHAGLKVGPVQNTYSVADAPADADGGMAPADTVDPAGTVLSQTPAPGHKVEPGMTVTFRVSQ